MHTYSYWNNKQGWHNELVFQCEATNILDADKQFFLAVGVDVVKSFNISCSISLKVLQ